MSLGCLLLAVELTRNGPRSIAARIGTLLLGICSAGLLVSAIFPTDLEGMPSTRTGDIHAYSFLVNVICIMLAALLLSVSFGSDPRWRPYKQTALILAISIMLGFVLQFLTLHRGMPYGLTNRLFVVLVYAWMFTTSFRLRALVSEG